MFSSSDLNPVTAKQYLYTKKILPIFAFTTH